MGEERGEKVFDQRLAIWCWQNASDESSIAAWFSCAWLAARGPGGNCMQLMHGDETNGDQLVLCYWLGACREQRQHNTWNRGVLDDDSRLLANDSCPTAILISIIRVDTGVETSVLMLKDPRTSHSNILTELTDDTVHTVTSHRALTARSTSIPHHHRHTQSAINLQHYNLFQTTNQNARARCYRYFSHVQPG